MKRHDSLAPLSREHHQALILAQLLKNDAPLYKGLPDTMGEKIKYALTFYSSELIHHFKLEEKIFDLARKINGTLEYLIVELIDEHRILTAMFSALQEAKNKPEKMNTLGELLTSHIRKEERQLFPLLEQNLTADQFLEIDHLLTEKTGL